MSSGSSGPEAEHFVEHFLDDAVLLGRGHGHALVVEQALDHAADFGAQAVLRERGDALQVEHADQLAVDLALELECAIAGARRQRAGGGALARLRTKFGSQMDSFS